MRVNHFLRSFLFRDAAEVDGLVIVRLVKSHCGLIVEVRVFQAEFLAVWSVNTVLAMLQNVGCAYILRPQREETFAVDVVLDCDHGICRN